MSEYSNQCLQDLGGTRIDERLTLVRLVGTGGMASVYEARDDGGRRVAVKILHARFASDDRVLSRFMREARLANSVGHPRVVPVEHVGMFGASPYLVMELLEGQSLEGVLRDQGPLTRMASTTKRTAAVDAWM